MSYYWKLTADVPKEKFNEMIAAVRKILGVEATWGFEKIRK